MKAPLLLPLVADPVFASASAPEIDQNIAAKGETIYEKYCETCHGVGLENNSGVSFDLRRLRAEEHDRFVNAVLNGKNAMPSWRGVLNEAAIDALWAYVRSNASQ